MTTNNFNDSFDGFSNKETYTMWHWINLDTELLVYLHQQLNRADPEASIKDWFSEQSMLLVEGKLSKRRAMMLVDIGSLWRVNYLEIIQRLKLSIK
jgi:hypothetical protein